LFFIFQFFNFARFVSFSFNWFAFSVCVKISLAYPFPRLSVGAGYWRGIL